MNENHYEGTDRIAYDEGKRYILLELCRYVAQGYTANEIQLMMLEKHKYLEIDDKGIRQEEQP